MPKPALRIARDTMRGYKMDPFAVSGLDIAGVAVWTRPADLKAKATDWRAKADRWSITLAFPHRTAPAPVPLDYWTGTGNRIVDNVNHRAGRPDRLPARPSVSDWENSYPTVPTVGAILACILNDASTWRDECTGLSDAEAADALVRSGLMADNPMPSEALALVAVLRDQHRRLQALEAAGVDPDALRDALDEAGEL